jgi:hypothetical protein
VCFDVLDSEILPRGLFELRDLVVETVVVEQFENAALFLLSIARPLDSSEMAVIGILTGPMVFPFTGEVGGAINGIPPCSGTGFGRARLYASRCHGMVLVGCQCDDTLVRPDPSAAR